MHAHRAAWRTRPVHGARLAADKRRAASLPPSDHDSKFTGGRSFRNGAGASSGVHAAAATQRAPRGTS
eukprot:845972-Prymnesium_polylepis.1